MKTNSLLRLSIGANVLFAVTVFLSCNQQKKSKIVEKTGCAQICMNYTDSAAYDLIDNRLLDTMATLYQAGITKGESISTWYSLADLKRFIWEIEHSVCNSSCANKSTSNLGIRIYFAKYPVKPGGNSSFRNLRNLDESYQMRNTLFMVPTFDDNLLIHTDFNLITGVKNNNCVLMKMSSDVTSPIGPVIPVGALLPTGKNHGPLCPPDDCSGAVFSN